MTTTLKRHSWTSDELKELEKAVKSFNTKALAFTAIAAKMGLTESAVSATWYNHAKDMKRIKPAKHGRVRPTSKGKGTTIHPEIGIKPATKSMPNPITSGRPFSLAGASESELIELAHAIQAEVGRRVQVLGEVAKLFTH